MTPKEKAQELVNKMRKYAQCEHYDSEDEIKQCALIAVDEIITAIDNLQYERKTDFWQEVQTEIEKL